VSDFAQNFIAGVTAGRQHVQAQADHERQLEELDLKKKLLKHQMNQFELEAKLKQQEHDVKMAEAKKKFFEGAQAPVGDVSNGVSGITGGGTFLDALAKGGPGARIDTAGMQPTGKNPVVEFPGGGAIQPKTDQEIQVDLKRAFDEKTAAQEALSKVNVPAGNPYGLPPGPMDREVYTAAVQAANTDKRLSFQAEQTDKQIAASERRTAMQINSAERRTAAQIEASAKRALGSAEPTDPTTIQWGADQLLKRKMKITDFHKARREEVEAELAKRGLDIPRPLTAQEINAQGPSASGLTALDNMEALLQKDPELTTKAITQNIPLVGGVLSRMIPGVSEFKTYRNEMVDILARIRTGAAISKYEEDFYSGQAPQFGDPPSAIKAKIAQFRGLYLATSGVPVTLVDPSGKQEAIIQDGYDPKQRLTMRKLISQGWTPEY